MKKWSYLVPVIATSAIAPSLMVISAQTNSATNPKVASLATENDDFTITTSQFHTFNVDPNLSEDLRLTFSSEYQPYAKWGFEWKYSDFDLTSKYQDLTIQQVFYDVRTNQVRVIAQHDGARIEAHVNVDSSHLFKNQANVLRTDMNLKEIAAIKSQINHDLRSVLFDVNYRDYLLSTLNFSGDNQYRDIMNEQDEKRGALFIFSAELPVEFNIHRTRTPQIRIFSLHNKYFETSLFLPGTLMMNETRMDDDDLIKVVPYTNHYIATFNEDKYQKFGSWFWGSLDNKQAISCLEKVLDYDRERYQLISTNGSDVDFIQQNVRGGSLNIFSLWRLTFKDKTQDDHRITEEYLVQKVPHYNHDFRDKFIIDQNNVITWFNDFMDINAPTYEEINDAKLIGAIPGNTTNADLAVVSDILDHDQELIDHWKQVSWYNIRQQFLPDDGLFNEQGANQIKEDVELFAPSSLNNNNLSLAWDNDNHLFATYQLGRDLALLRVRSEAEKAAMTYDNTLTSTRSELLFSPNKYFENWSELTKEYLDYDQAQLVVDQVVPTSDKVDVIYHLHNHPQKIKTTLYKNYYESLPDDQKNQSYLDSQTTPKEDEQPEEKDTSSDDNDNQNQATTTETSSQTDLEVTTSETEVQTESTTSDQATQTENSTQDSSFTPKIVHQNDFYWWVWFIIGVLTGFTVWLLFWLIKMIHNNKKNKEEK